MIQLNHKCLVKFGLLPLNLLFQTLGTKTPQKMQEDNSKQQSQHWWLFVTWFTIQANLTTWTLPWSIISYQYSPVKLPTLTQKLHTFLIYSYAPLIHLTRSMSIDRAGQCRLRAAPLTVRDRRCRGTAAPPCPMSHSVWRLWEQRDPTNTCCLCDEFGTICKECPKNTQCHFCPFTMGSSCPPLASEWVCSCLTSEIPGNIWRYGPAGDNVFYSYRVMYYCLQI